MIFKPRFWSWYHLDIPSTEPVTTSKQIVGEGSGDEETDVSQSTLASTTPDSTGSGDDTGEALTKTS